MRRLMVDLYFKKIRDKLGDLCSYAQAQTLVCGEGHNGQRPIECPAAVAWALFNIHNQYLHSNNGDGYVAVHGEDKMRM